MQPVKCVIVGDGAIGVCPLPASPPPSYPSVVALLIFLCAAVNQTENLFADCLHHQKVLFLGLPLFFFSLLQTTNTLFLVW
jgi:hypothetical protein